MDVMRAVLDEAGIGDAFCLASLPAGWLAPMEIAARGMADLVSMHPADADPRSADPKETFGRLKVRVREGDPDLAEGPGQIALRVMAGCNGRCMVAGRAGSSRSIRRWRFSRRPTTCA